MLNKRLVKSPNGMRQTKTVGRQTEDLYLGAPAPDRRGWADERVLVAPFNDATGRKRSTARSEQGRADPDVGRADHHGRLEVARHAHAEPGEALVARKLGE